MRLGLTFLSVLLMFAVGCSPTNQAVSQTPTSSPAPIADSSPSPSSEPTPTPSPIAVRSPLPSPVSSPAKFLYVEISGSDYGNVDALTQGGATCTARAILPSGTDAPGLRNRKVADVSGNVAWVYPQRPTETGIGTHIVTCSLRGLRGTAYAYFQVGS